MPQDAGGGRTPAQLFRPRYRPDADRWHVQAAKEGRVRLSFGRAGRTLVKGAATLLNCIATGDLDSGTAGPRSSCGAR